MKAQPALPRELLQRAVRVEEILAQAREAAHLCGHHDGVVAMSRCHRDRDFAFAFAACLY
jgi:hypothetical protein